MFKMKVLSFAIGTFLTMVGLIAIYAGIGLIIDPSGIEFGMSVDILENSPFVDFLFPGIALLLINGFFSLFCAYLALNFDHYAGATTIILGSVMLIGGATQFFWIGWVSWIHSAFIIIGLFAIGLGYLLFILQKENYSGFRKYFDSNFN